MARKFTPRHKAREDEAKREIPKPPRFNQKPRAESGDLMFPLNRTIPDGVVPLLDMGVRSIERTITETAQEMPKITLRAIIDVMGANDVLSNFIASTTESLQRVNEARAIGSHHFEYANYFHYEGTVYAVIQIDIDEGDDLDYYVMSGGRTTIRLQNGYITITGEALPDILKIKEGRNVNGTDT